MKMLSQESFENDDFGLLPVCLKAKNIQGLS